MQAACAARFSLYPSVFLFQAISPYLLMSSVSYLQHLRKGQSTTRSPACADQAPVLDGRGQMDAIPNVSARSFTACSSPTIVCNKLLC